jgi:PAS domain S-box-containing protein
MKIAGRLKLAAGVPAMVALVIVLALTWSLRVNEGVQHRQETAHELVNRVNELNGLVRSYLIYRSERPWSQFQAAYKDLTELLESERFEDLEQAHLAERVGQRTAMMANAFGRLVDNAAHPETVEATAIAREAEERLSGQILVRSRQALAGALTLEDLVADEGAVLNRRVSWLIMGLALAMAALTTVILRPTMGHIHRSLARLQAAVETVTGGDLDHRTGIVAKDEVGALARAFDTMTTRLQSTTVSRDGLAAVVAAREKAEEALRRSEERARWQARFPEENPNPVVRVSAAGTVLYRNPSAAGQPSWQCEIGRPVGPDVLQGLVARAIAEGRSIEEDVELDGEYFAVAVSPVPGEGYANLYGRDISDRRRAQEGLLRVKEEWERTFDTVPDLIAILDREHRVVRANRAMAQRMGLTAEECVGMYCYQLAHGTDRPPAFCPHSLTCMDGREHTVEVHEDRLDADFLVTTVPLTAEDGRQIGSVHVARDITDRKQAEEALRKSHESLEQRVAERTAELQRLARELTKAEEQERHRIAQVLHDDLQQTLAYAKLRAHCLAAPEKAAEHAEAAQDVLGALSAAIETCRNMSHALHPHRVHADGLSAGLRLLAAQTRERFALEVETSLDDGDDLNLPEELQLFVFRAAAEFLFNCAKHARTDRAHLTLEREGDNIRVAVEDKGLGFDPKAFDIAGGDAESFGLSTVGRRARFLGGELHVRSAPGAGTKCTLKLPIRPIPDENGAGSARTAS